MSSREKRPESEMISGMVGAPGCGRWLEVVAKAELHAPWQILHSGVGTQVSASKPGTQRSDWVTVEAHAVADVEDFPVEFESSVLLELPGLGQSGIDSEGAISAEVVAFPSFAGI